MSSSEHCPHCGRQTDQNPPTGRVTCYWCDGRLSVRLQDDLTDVAVDTSNDDTVEIAALVEAGSVGSSGGAVSAPVKKRKSAAPAILLAGGVFLGTLAVGAVLLQQYISGSDWAGLSFATPAPANGAPQRVPVESSPPPEPESGQISWNALENAQQRGEFARAIEICRQLERQAAEAGLADQQQRARIRLRKLRNLLKLQAELDGGESIFSN